MLVRLVEDKQELEQCLSIRRIVFIDEQGVSEADELDGEEDLCQHWLALDENDNPIGTARLHPIDEVEAKAQRVAVLPAWRGLGVGTLLMTALELHAAEKGHQRILLGAQLTAIPFYENLGYEVCSDVFDDAGIPHKMMQKSLDEYRENPDQEFEM